MLCHIQKINYEDDILAKSVWFSIHDPVQADLKGWGTDATKGRSQI